MTLKLTKDVLKLRQFNQYFYDLHTKQFMVGRTEPFIDKNKTVLDIGAAVGLYSTFWATKCKNLVAYEAVEPVYKQLKKLESKFDNVKTKNIAVGRQVGTVDFWVDDKRLSNSSFENLVGGQKVEVNVTTIDLERHENVGFIKVDVEGFELDVLEGGELTIDRDRPVCMVEIYPKFNQGPVWNTFNFFFQKNYRCFFNQQKHGLTEIKSIGEGVAIAESEYLQKDHDGDFLFVPTEWFTGMTTWQ